MNGTIFAIEDLMKWKQEDFSQEWNLDSDGQEKLHGE